MRKNYRTHYSEGASSEASNNWLSGLIGRISVRRSALFLLPLPWTIQHTHHPAINWGCGKAPLPQNDWWLHAPTTVTVCIRSHGWVVRILSFIFTKATWRPIVAVKGVVKFLPGLLSSVVLAYYETFCVCLRICRVVNCVIIVHGSIFRHTSHLELLGRSEPQ